MAEDVGGDVFDVVGGDMRAAVEEGDGAGDRAAPPDPSLATGC